MTVIKVTTTSAGQSPQLLMDIKTLLEAQGVPYVAIGAIAAAVHGVVRASLDADAVISACEAVEHEIVRGLKEAGLHVEHRWADQEDPLLGVIVVTDSWGNEVDLLLGIKGFDREAYQRAIQLPLLNGELKVVGLEDFVAMKVFAGGPQDLADARAAIYVSRDDLDRELALELADRYGKSVHETLNELIESVIDIADTTE
jgi:hypothetical protein